MPPRLLDRQLLRLTAERLRGSAERIQLRFFCHGDRRLLRFLIATTGRCQDWLHRLVLVRVTRAVASVIEVLAHLIDSLLEVVQVAEVAFLRVREVLEAVGALFEAQWSGVAKLSAVEGSITALILGLVLERALAFCVVGAGVVASLRVQWTALVREQAFLWLGRLLPLLLAFWLRRRDALPRLLLGRAARVVACRLDALQRLPRGVPAERLVAAVPRHLLLDVDVDDAAAAELGTRQLSDQVLVARGNAGVRPARPLQARVPLRRRVSRVLHVADDRVLLDFPDARHYLRLGPLGSLQRLLRFDRNTESRRPQQ